MNPTGADDRDGDGNGGGGRDGDRDHGRADDRDRDSGAGVAPVVSVVIPAHDEAAVIGRLLDALREGTGPGRIEVVVAANGCTDDTAAVARGHGARVVEVAEASKIAALNAGDAAATAFPRVYCDADVTITGRTVERLARALAEPGVLCAAPPLTVEVAGRPWAVRSFYAIWQDIPYMRDRHVGSGVFAMSEEGRRRFGDWPDVIADDLFGRILFSRDERRVVGAEPFVVQAPWTAGALLRRRRRIHAGNMQVDDDPELSALPGRREAQVPWWTVVVGQPWLAPAAVPYAAVNAAAKLGARRLRRARSDIAWDRDDTTRDTARTGAGTIGTGGTRATGTAGDTRDTAGGDTSGGPRPAASAHLEDGARP